jgi:hypothetical protein
LAASVRRLILSSILFSLAACAAEPEPAPPDLDAEQQALSAAVELSRLTAIRDVAASVGLDNGVLLAGIAQSETNLSHCWSEATWACKGPSSPSCGGGPVIAGASDGACSLQQGGLGMFQFDGGTFSQTLDRDGEDILLLEGNITHAVEFVQEGVIAKIPGVNENGAALDWLNSIPMEAGDPVMEAWASFIVCRYNGCCGTGATCTKRRRDYRDNAINFYNQYGADFWAASTPPAPDDEMPEEEEQGTLSGGAAVGGCAAGGSSVGGLGLLLVGAVVATRRRRRA